MKMQFPVKVILHVILTGLMFVLPFRVYSQEAGSCAENLKNAQALFARGQVEQVPSMLSECMKSGFSREEYLDAYKLLIQSYLFEDKLEKADSAMLEFLKKNPEYELSPTDHSSFVHLFGNFVVKPVVQVSFHFGTNIPFLTFITDRYVSGVPGASIHTSNIINLFASFETKFELNKKLEINFEPGYSNLAFTNSDDYNDIVNDKVIKVGETTYTESQKRIEMPVSATYNFKRFGKFTPYGRFGVGPAITLKSSATAIYKPTSDDAVSGPEINRKTSRISLDVFTQTGAGVKYKTRGGYLFTELRSNFGFIYQAIGDGSSAEDQELSVTYHYTDDDFHLNTLNFTVGYTQIFYKPSKR
ncbi:MAG: hypothetical protein IPH69_02575 [Bacteroidales bacterium]|nr:hypothetical protein [Bacteroidales bacterium]